MPQAGPPASSYEGLTSDMKLASDQGPGSKAGTRDQGLLLYLSVQDFQDFACTELFSESYVCSFLNLASLEVIQKDYPAER